MYERKGSVRGWRPSRHGHWRRSFSLCLRSMARHNISSSHLKSGSEALMTVSISCPVAIADFPTTHMGFQRCRFFRQSPSTERRAERVRRKQASRRMEASQSPEARCPLSPPAPLALCQYDASSLFCCATGKARTAAAAPHRATPRRQAMSARDTEQDAEDARPVGDEALYAENKSTLMLGHTHIYGGTR